jgi:hypothetical protein
VSAEFHHGTEPRAEEIALHQRFLTLQGQMEAAQDEGDESEIRRLRPLLEHAPQPLAEGKPARHAWTLTNAPSLGGVLPRARLRRYPDE